MTSLSKWYLPVIFLALFLRNAVGQSAAEVQVNGARMPEGAQPLLCSLARCHPQIASEFLISGTNLRATSTSDVESLGRMQPVMRLKYFPLSG
jgi:hypothetical protein